MNKYYKKETKSTLTTLDDNEVLSALRLPIAGRKKVGMNTICDRCRKHIEDEFFIGVITNNNSKNLKFHESCYNGKTK